MKTTIIGANGQLGTDLVAEAAARGWEVQALDHSSIQVEDSASVEAALSGGTDVVINTAALHKVDDCESRVTESFAVNAGGPANLARWAERNGARLVQISTDYVFGGEKSEPYTESDCPWPVNVYGMSKLAGEHAALAYDPRAAVVRVSAIYGQAPCRAKGGENFVRLMLRLGRERGAVKVVDDQRVSPTYTAPLAGQLCDVAADPEMVGIFHAVSEGECTWYEFAKTIFDFAGMSVDVTPVSSDAFPSTVRRPQYSVLDNARLRQAGTSRMPHWRDGLREYLAHIAPTVAS